MKRYCGVAADEERRPAGCARGRSLPIWRAMRAPALLAFAIALQAQAQRAGSPPQEQIQQSSDHAQQSPGAQLHTGTSLGVDVETRLQNLLADHQFAGIEAQLSKLPAQEAEFYRGILANRDNDAQASIHLLEPLAAQMTVSGNVAKENELRKALAEDYLRLGDWARAAQAYQTLATDPKSGLSQDEQDEIEMPVKLLPLAMRNPAMMVDPSAQFSIQGTMDPLGLTDVPVFVDARPHAWMLDPTLPFNLIANSTARNAGLAMSDEAATIRTLTGRTMEVRSAVVPRFTIGGVLTLRNMTAFVYNDTDYYFPYTHYQVEGVLGYPALEAMGSLTVTNEEMIFVGPTQETDAAGKGAAGGARFYLDGDEILAALGKDEGAGGGDTGVPGIERMYVVDAGGQQSYLTSRYYDEHMADFAGMTPQMYSLPGPMPSSPQPAYVAQSVPLTIGGVRVELHFVPVFTLPLGGGARDDVYGVLGADALGQLKSYTFNYRTMRFSVTAE